MARRNAILFRRREVFTQLHGLARGHFGFVLVSQQGVDLTELGISEREFRVLLSSGLETLARLKIVSLARQFEALVVVTQSRNRLGGRLEGLNLEFLNHRSGEGQILPNSSR